MKSEYDNDKRIVLEEEHHIYKIDGVTDYISVTGFKKTWFGDGFNAQKVSQDLEANQSSHSYAGMTSEGIQEMWRQDCKQASEKGKTLHAMIEHFYRALEVAKDTSVLRSVPNNADYLRRYKRELNDECVHFRDVIEGPGGWQNFLRFVCSNKTWRPRKVEWKVFYERYKLAGAIDAMFEIPMSDGSVRVALCDWKTTRTLRFKSLRTLGNPNMFKGLGVLEATNYNEYVVQLNMYRIIIEDCYDVKVDLLMIIRLPEYADRFEIHLCPKMEQPFRDILEHRRLHHLS